MFLPLLLLWSLWICHYLRVHCPMYHVPEQEDSLRRRVKKINHKLDLEERKHEKLRRRFKQIHRKLKELEDNYKMQYEHFTQLIDHVRTDLLDHITV